LKAVATFLAALAAACLAAAVWLFLKTYRFYQGADYAPNSPQQPGYAAGQVEADGGGIFAPSVLLFFLGLFLARFAWNLWRGGARRTRRDE